MLNGPGMEYQAGNPCRHGGSPRRIDGCSHSRLGYAAKSSPGEGWGRLRSTEQTEFDVILIETGCSSSRGRRRSNC